MWIYEQATGKLFRDEQHVGTGYSGHGIGVNNPEAQAQHNIGPIPRGLWYIKEPFNSAAHGPFCLRLQPDPSNQMFGRSGFLIHGDSKTHPGEASEGCIVVSRDIREAIWDSDDGRLMVV